MNLNKALLYGNLTRDPELKSLPSGTKVTTFSVATNRVWMKDGEKQESVDFHNIVVFGRQAETVAQYLRKGSGALVEGRIQTRSWEAKDGTKRYTTEIVADRIQFGPKSGGGGSYNEPKKEEKNNKSEEEIDTIEYPEEEINPDDIPF